MNKSLKILYNKVKQEAQLMLRNPARRDIIRREEKYRQLVGRRIVCGGSINVSAGRRVVQHSAIAQRFYQTENF